MTNTAIASANRQGPRNRDGWERSGPAQRHFSRSSDRRTSSGWFPRKRAETLRAHESISRGFLVLGDAICSFNPLYGQGMSVAVLEVFELHKVLREGSQKLAQKFFSRAAKIVGAPWSMAAGNDLRMPDVLGKRTLVGHFLHWYLAKLNTAGRCDRSAVIAFQKTQNLLAPPQSLFTPLLMARVFSAAISSRPMTAASPKSAQQTA